MRINHHLKILYFFILIIPSGVISQTKMSQQKMDSILSNPREFNYNADKIQKVFEQQPQLKGKSVMLARKAHENYITDQKDSAFYFANTSIATYQASNQTRTLDEEHQSRAYYIKARVLEDNKDYYNSIKYLLKAIDIAEKYNYKWIGYYYSSLATNHLNMGDRNKALAVNFQLIKDSSFMAYEGDKVYNRIGLIHSYLQQRDSAKYYYRKLLSLKKITNRSLFAAYVNLGDISRYEQKKDSSIFYYKKADSIADVHHLDIPLVTINKGFLLQNEGQFSKAKAIYKLALDSLASYNKINKDDKETYSFVYDNLIVCLKQEGNFQEALQISIEKNAFIERYNEELLAEQLSDLTIQYEVKQKDLSIANLKEKNEAQTTILQQRNIIIGGVLVLLILGGLIGFQILRKRKMTHQFKITNLEQRLLRSQLNPHFLFNALNKVVSLSSLKSEQTTPYTLKLSRLLRSILKNSREDFISLQDELDTVKDYLELQSEFSEKFTYSITVDDTLDIEDLFIPPMFIQPFIENSIQHGFKGKKGEKIEVLIKFGKHKKTIHCAIKDNGVGYSQTIQKNSKRHASLSGNIIKERLLLYAKTFKTKAYYKITEPQLDSGTQVDVFLPYMLDT